MMAISRSGVSFSLVVTVTLMCGYAADEDTMNTEVYELCEPSGTRTLQLDSASSPFIIQSPNFGVQNYSNNADCKLVIESGAEPLVLSYYFSKFNVEYNVRCYYDSLCLHGMIYCGTWLERLVLENILPENGTSTIVFKTDASNTHPGFELCQCIQVYGDNRLCSITSDCLPGECCLSSVSSRGRREAPGYCKPRGDVGTLCYVKNDQLQAPDSDVQFLDACPCRATLECQGTGQVEVPQGEQGKCITTNATDKRASKCSNLNDCASDECCASLAQPVGRRKRGIGECRKLQQAGDSCLVSITTAQDVSFECPCDSALTCKGTGLFEIPLGERGICTA